MEHVDSAIIRLFENGGLTYTDIGALVGLNRSQVAGKVHRLRKAGLITVTKVRRSPMKMRRAQLLRIPVSTGRIKRFTYTKKNPVKIVTKEDLGNSMKKAHENVEEYMNGSGPVSIDELKELHCRWLFSDNTYCGDKKSRGSFCEKHAAICYQS